ncbi:hypothetical protein [Bradyrhizobium sp. UFLA05-112]
MIATIRVRFSRPRKIVEPITPPPVVSPDVIQRDDGMFQIGVADDAPGPFESRAFAAAVAATNGGRGVSNAKVSRNGLGTGVVPPSDLRVVISAVGSGQITPEAHTAPKFAVALAYGTTSNAPWQAGGVGILGIIDT